MSIRVPLIAYGAVLLAAGLLSEGTFRCEGDGAHTALDLRLLATGTLLALPLLAGCVTLVYLSAPLSFALL